MKQCKKLLCLCLLALSLTVLFSLTAPRAAAAEHSGSCGENLTWSFDPTTGVLTFSGSGKMQEYSVFMGFDPPWYQYASEIKEIILPEGLTTISPDAFAECYNVSEIRFPSTLERIGDSSFRWCNNIRTITIPKKVSHISGGAFQDMGSLTKIVVEKDNPYFTTDARGVLYTKSMDRLLRCPEIFPGTYTVPAQVKEIYYNAFFSCHGMTEITIPGHISNLDSRTFLYCPDLQKITITGENDDYYTDSQGVLYDRSFDALVLCPRGYLGNCVIPQGTKEIWDDAFSGCASLTGVTIPNSVYRIGNNAFDGCYALKTLTLPNSVEEIGMGAFANCKSLHKVSLSSKLSQISEYMFAECSALTSVSIPKGITVIEPYAFMGCTNLTGVSIPEGVREIGEAAFKNCTYLKEITLPDSVTVIESEIFASCPYLKKVRLSENLTEIPLQAFYDCERLESITIPDSVTCIDFEAFCDCSALRSITIPDSVEYIGSAAFAYCFSMTSAYLPAELPTGASDVFYSSWLEDVYFAGNAPDPEDLDACWCIGTNVTLHFVESTKGWTYPTWNGYHTERWHGMITTDVKEQDYFYTPVQWALWHGITNGMGKDRFQPESTCTRGQIVTFLWRAAGCPEPTAKENPFTDVSSKAYYYKAVLWAVEKDITKGMGKGLFVPDGECTRAQVATFLWRYYGKPTATTVSIPFTDVLPNTYYTQAVLWAVEKEITNGMGNNKFAPNSPCTRGQIVTFLWRAAGKPNAVPEIVKDPTYRALYHPVVESLMDSLKEKALYQNYYSAGVLYDLDQNGIEELILLYSLPHDDNSASPHQAVCDVYTVQNEQLVPLMEGHRFGYLVGGGDAHAGIAKIDGQTYLYCLNSSYDKAGSDDYDYIEQQYTKWQLFRLEGKSLQAVTTVELDLRYGYKEEYCCCPMLLPEQSVHTVNGEEKPLEDYDTWRESISSTASIGPARVYEASEKVGHLLEDLLTLCF